MANQEHRKDGKHAVSLDQSTRLLTENSCFGVGLSQERNIKEQTSSCAQETNICHIKPNFASHSRDAAPRPREFVGCRAHTRKAEKQKRGFSAGSECWCAASVGVCCVHRNCHTRMGRGFLPERLNPNPNPTREGCTYCFFSFAPQMDRKRSMLTSAHLLSFIRFTSPKLGRRGPATRHIGLFRCKKP